MGAVGLNGAVAQAADPRERLALSSTGWGRWTPVSAAAVLVHTIGDAGLVGADKARVTTQPDARANTVAQTGLIGVAVALTAYSGVLGRTVSQKSRQGGAGATKPPPQADEDLAKGTTSPQGGPVGDSGRRRSCGARRPAGTGDGLTGPLR